MKIVTRTTAGLLVSISLASLTGGCSSQENVTVQQPNNPVSQAGPLDIFTGLIWGVSADATPAEMNEQLESEHRWRENYIASCMLESGFTYLPDLSQPPQMIFPEGPHYRTREFAEQFGFGFSGGEFWGSQPAVSDPENSANVEQLEAMSETERAAWFIAYWGNSHLFDLHEDYQGELIWGCRQLSSDAFRGLNSDNFTALAEQVRQFSEVVATTPARIALDTEWAACMAQLGYPGHHSPVALIRGIIDELNIIRTQANANSIMVTWDWNTFPEGPPGFYLGDDGEWVLPQSETQTISDFAVRERELAIAEVDCREQIDYDNRAAEINFQEQQKFVDLHQDELEAWLAAANASRSLG